MYEYEILQESCKHDLELLLNQRTKNGWKPCGNLIITHHVANTSTNGGGYNRIYYSILIKKQVN